MHRMLYAIACRDVPDSLPLRRPLRPAHLARLEHLRDAGRLVIAGPHPAIDAPEAGASGFTGSLIVAEFDSLQDAQAWLEADPYVTGGVFAQTSVKPFIQVLP
jgi:hypothetical protein